MLLTELRLVDAQAAASRFEKSHLAANTLKAYRHDWQRFTEWCAKTGLVPLPASPETVRLYLAHLIQSGRKIATAVRRTSGITHYHREAGLKSPCGEAVWELLNGAQRLLKEQPAQKRPLTIQQIREISQKLASLQATNPLALRNRALIVLGFSTSLRRSNLAALDLLDLTFTGQGLIVEVRHDKQDQKGKGRFIGVPFGKHRDTCGVETVRDWLAVRGLDNGPLFLGPGRRRLRANAVAEIVKDAARLIGLNPAHYAGHSLRSGFITAAGEAGLGEFLIASQTGHKTMEILRGYFRRTHLFRSNACHALDL